MGFAYFLNKVRVGIAGLLVEFSESELLPVPTICGIQPPRKEVLS